MARLDRSGSPRGPVVQGFTATGFTVDGAYHDAMLLTPERTLAWDAPTLDELDGDSLAPLLALDPPPEFILLGTGALYRTPPRSLVAELEGRGIGLEAMDSRAAARTWGLLRGEERWIAAAIMSLR